MKIQNIYTQFTSKRKYMVTAQTNCRSIIKNKIQFSIICSIHQLTTKRVKAAEEQKENSTFEH